jgi:hypothetical protein
MVKIEQIQPSQTQPTVTHADVNRLVGRILLKRIAINVAVVVAVHVVVSKVCKKLDENETDTD